MGVQLNFSMLPSEVSTHLVRPVRRSIFYEYYFPHFGQLHGTFDSIRHKIFGVVYGNDYRDSHLARALLL
jgi:hypothetical protein